MSAGPLTLDLLPGRFAVCRLDPEAPDPTRILFSGPFASVTHTADELSIVCAESQAPPGARCEPGWRCLRVRGPLPFSAVGILASLTAPLAATGVSLFAVSTFDTDYLLVQESDLDRALTALRAAGHEV
jgi:hypothetical protein